MQIKKQLSEALEREHDLQKKVDQLRLHTAKDESQAKKRQVQAQS
jgi:hypothetical protein